jgi:hypothetical protein
MSTEGGQNYRDHYADLERQLQNLRSLFSLDESPSDFRDYFDDYLNANEFELALDRLCDFLLSTTTPGIGPNELEKIDAVYRSMDLGNDRTSALRAKSEIWFPSQKGLEPK